MRLRVRLASENFLGAPASMTTKTDAIYSAAWKRGRGVRTDRESVFLPSLFLSRRAGCLVEMRFILPGAGKAPGKLFTGKLRDRRGKMD